jgi:dTDP-4-dehydrorhamnose reductase
MKSALIIGENSHIGKALHKQLSAAGCELFATGRATLDLAKPQKSWPKLPKAEAAFLCAAITKLDTCELDPVTTQRVNVVGTSALAKKLGADGTFPVFLSTNHVFDGARARRVASDPVSPNNAYGLQKSQGEKATLAAGGAVVRLGKVVPRGDARIIEWCNALKAGKKITAFDDMYLAPITLDNALAALIAIAESRKSGIYQLSGERDISYHGLALALAKQLGANALLVEHGSAAASGILRSFCPRHVTLAQTLPQTVAVPDTEGIIAYALDLPMSAGS